MLLINYLYSSNGQIGFYHFFQKPMKMIIIIRKNSGFGVYTLFKNFVYTLTLTLRL